MAFSGTTTPEYKAVQRLTAELVNAVQNDLFEVSNQLLSRGMITVVSHDEFTDLRSATAHERASKLIRTILNKIKMDSRNFDTLVQVLGENELYYKSVLDKLESYRERENLTRSALSTDREGQNLAHSLDLEQSDNELESSPFLRFSTPYIQYGHKRVSSSNPQRGYIFERRGTHKLSPFTDCPIECSSLLNCISIVMIISGYAGSLLFVYYYGCHVKMYIFAMLYCTFYACFPMFYFKYLAPLGYKFTSIIKFIVILCLFISLVGLWTYVFLHFCH